MSLVLWGIGQQGEKIYALVKTFVKERFKTVIDNDACKYANDWHGYIVINSEDYINIIHDSDIVIVSPKRYQDIVEFCLDNTVEYILYDDYVQKLFLCQINEYRQTFCHDLYGDVFSAQHPVVYMSANFSVLQILFEGRCKYLADTDMPEETDLLILHGLAADFNKLYLLYEAKKKNIKVCLCEDGFVRSIVTYNACGYDEKYIKSHSVVLDFGGLYIDANSASDLERMLNSKEKLDNDVLLRVKRIIKKMITKQISKYNHQKNNMPIMYSKKRKILVIDQVDGDMSVLLGNFSEKKFLEMLDAACKENLGADILVKVHPDMRRSFCAGLRKRFDICILDADYNPIELISMVDKVYVGTSQMGFEACMCGKEVHVFGMPFYAGWGFTHDRQKCERRICKRSVEEVFYFAYMLYSHYVSYKTNSACEIEQCIDEIIELREDFF